MNWNPIYALFLNDERRFMSNGKTWTRPFMSICR
jgi:hypothetical protein